MSDKEKIKTLHWLVAFLLITLIAAGVYIVNNELNEESKIVTECNCNETNDNINQEQEKDNNDAKEMTEELAYGVLNKYKNENLKDANWYIGKVELVAHGDNNIYWVTYESVSLDGYTTEVGAFIEYKNNEWVTELPGFSGYEAGDFDKYNFINY